ncbi:PiggyBac transposable element-derived protein 1 [Araneus ventricosus]|uniref:PiggyBac transposable element-derived protein 1 n=1 Tax=Araneus ventricosus TaxID=182803 RepID=A0A4Y2EP24_ARAVE|nr:PiggyBac transposable element-derived protein 1 [Araneus ventricosus]
MRQYVKGKPNPVGLKVFVMCTTYGLPLDFIFYEGKGTDVQSPEDTSDLDLGGKIALKLSDSLQPWSSFYVDRYFTSELLFDILLNREVFATGTLMKNKVPKLTELQTDRYMKRNGRGSVDQIVRNDKRCCLVKWFDNRGVLLLSTKSGKLPMEKCSLWSKKKKYLDINRPAIVKNYNEFMGGVDHLDRCISNYRMKNWTKKWTVRVILHMINFAVSSAWIAYRHKMEAAGALKKDIFYYFHFRLNVATTLIYGTKQSQQRIATISSSDESIEDSEPPARRRIPACMPHDSARKKDVRHMPEMVGDRIHRSKCRMPKCNALTTVRCSKCKVFLCFNGSRNCVKQFHEK